MALALLLPAPIIGTAAAMLIPATEGPIGQGIYVACKVWLLALPLVWLLLVERRRISLSPARRGGFVVGSLLGGAIAAVIVAAHFILGPQFIDPQFVQSEAAANGIGTPGRFLAFAFYTCAVNALLEEYVWRWFVFRKCETLVGGLAAVLLSALFFTIHHVLALSAQFGWQVTVLGSIGVFMGGTVWSALYLRYRSIWPGYLSHLIVDVAILAIAWKLIFGS